MLRELSTTEDAEDTEETIRHGAAKRRCQASRPDARAGFAGRPRRITSSFLSVLCVLSGCDLLLSSVVEIVSASSAVSH